MSETVDQETGEITPTSRDWVMMPPEPMRLHAALHAAVERLPTWVTTDKSGAHKIKYATLKAILETVRPVLAEQGIRIRQGAEHAWAMDDGVGKGRMVPVFTELILSATGEREITKVEIPLTKLDPQGMGSAITYGRRYSLLAALGITTDEADDDGEAAKPKSLNEAHQDSEDLATMTRELQNHTDLTKLEDWARDSKQRVRFNALESEEQALLKARKAQHVKALMEAPPPAKKAKGE